VLARRGADRDQVDFAVLGKGRGVGMHPWYAEAARDRASQLFVHVRHGHGLDPVHPRNGREVQAGGGAPAADEADP
jgi:hypothetical protein